MNFTHFWTSWYWSMRVRSDFLSGGEAAVRSSQRFSIAAICFASSIWRASASRRRRRAGAPCRSRAGTSGPGRRCPPAPRAGRAPSRLRRSSISAASGPSPQPRRRWRRCGPAPITTLTVSASRDERRRDRPRPSRPARRTSCSGAPPSRRRRASGRGAYCSFTTSPGVAPGIVLVEQPLMYLRPASMSLDEGRGGVGLVCRRSSSGRARSARPSRARSAISVAVPRTDLREHGSARALRRAQALLFDPPHASSAAL